MKTKIFAQTMQSKSSASYYIERIFFNLHLSFTVKNTKIYWLQTVEIENVLKFIHFIVLVEFGAKKHT